MSCDDAMTVAPISTRSLLVTCQRPLTRIVGLRSRRVCKALDGPPFCRPRTRALYLEYRAHKAGFVRQLCAVKRPVKRGGHEVQASRWRTSGGRRRCQAVEWQRGRAALVEDEMLSRSRTTSACPA